MQSNQEKTNSLNVGKAGSYKSEVWWKIQFLVSLRQNKPGNYFAILCRIQIQIGGFQTGFVLLASPAVQLEGQWNTHTYYTEFTEITQNTHNTQN